MNFISHALIKVLPKQRLLVAQVNMHVQHNQNILSVHFFKSRMWRGANASLSVLDCMVKSSIPQLPLTSIQIINPLTLLCKD